MSKYLKGETENIDEFINIWRTIIDELWLHTVSPEIMQAIQPILSTSVISTVILKITLVRC